MGSTSAITIAQGCGERPTGMIASGQAARSRRSLTPTERRAKAHLMRRRAEAIRAGTWQPFVPDATATRTRIRFLRDAGFSIPAIAAATTTALRTIEDILTDPTRRITHEVERRILSANLDPRCLPGTVLVAPHGTRRRIDTLAVHAWDYASLGAEAGVPGHTISNTYKVSRPTAATAALIADLYDRLWATDGPSATSRRRAIGAGKVDTWNEETIDDPAAVPNPDAKPPGGVDLEAADWMLRAGEGLERVAERLGVTEKALVTASYRRGAPDQHARVAQAARELGEIRFAMASAAS